MKARSPARRGGAFALGFPLVLLLALGAEGADTVACREGLEFRLTSRAPVQGSLVLVEVKSTEPVAELTGEGFGQPLRFWRGSNPEHSYQALLGVDLERNPGNFPVTINAALENGKRLACSALATVREGEFITERLQVPRKFVELAPEDLERARQESRRLGKIFATVSPERLWRGAFRFPLQGVEGSGNFGRRRLLNNQPRSPHSGEDYPADKGTPVRAPQGGRVVLADNLFFSGNTVVLDHGLGLYTFYGHLDSVAVKEGTGVEAGTVLGRVGATGRVTGAHLHWAVRLNRTRINPRDLVEVLSENSPR